MKKIIVPILFMLFSISTINAQPIIPDPPQLDSLKNFETKLKALGDTILDGWNEFSRIDAVTDYIPLLVKALKVQQSYYYPFDSLRFMYKIESPDGKFRILNWTMKFDNGTYRYYGCIQFSDPAKRRIIPLIDMSDRIPFDAVEDTILTNQNWFGMQYYSISKIKIKKTEYYLLLGWDGNDLISHKKIIELMHFEDNKAIFGAPVIKLSKEDVVVRKVYQYSADAIFSLKWIPEKKLIAFDHLVPQKPEYEGKPWLYVPDGAYDCFLLKPTGFLFKTGLFDKIKMPKEIDNQ